MGRPWVSHVGEVVGAGLLAHVPTIMLPYETRLELNEGKDFTLVPGLERLRRDVFSTLDYDTVVVLDSHWATTVEFVVTAQTGGPGCSPRRSCRGGCAASRTTSPAIPNWPGRWRRPPPLATPG
jgi:hypothetical protein